MKNITRLSSTLFFLSMLFLNSPKELILMFFTSILSLSSIVAVIARYKDFTSEYKETYLGNYISSIIIYSIFYIVFQSKILFYMMIYTIVCYFVERIYMRVYELIYENQTKGDKSRIQT
jgi:hypothetical protein